MTIIMVQYIFFAVYNRLGKYESFERLFQNTKEDIVELRLQEMLIALLIAILDIIASLFGQVDAQGPIKKIINDEQLLKKISMLVNPYENRTNNVA